MNINTIDVENETSENLEYYYDQISKLKPITASILSMKYRISKEMAQREASGKLNKTQSQRKAMENKHGRQ